jgi:hypothetical protein
MIYIVTNIIVFLLHCIIYVCIWSALYVWQVALYAVHVDQICSSLQIANMYDVNRWQHAVVYVNIMQLVGSEAAVCA